MAERNDAVRDPHVPSIPGDRCIRVLIACGWLPVDWTERTCTLVNDARRIVVPRHSMLDQETLAALLESGGVQPFRFVVTLERICAQELSSLRTVRDRLAR